MREARLGVVWAIALSACSSRIDSVPPSGGRCTAALERSRILVERIEAEWPLRHADVVTALVDRMGADLARATRRHDAWRFGVVRDRASNAFSIGGGVVYVTEGAIRTAESEAELAALLAHEMAHDLLGHFCTEASPWLIARRGDATQLGSVSQAIDPAHEREADRYSLVLLEGARYDPRASADILRRVALTESVGRWGQLVERIADLERLTADKPPGRRRDTRAFREARARLLDEDVQPAR